MVHGFQRVVVLLEGLFLQHVVLYLQLPVLQQVVVQLEVQVLEVLRILAGSGNAPGCGLSGSWRLVIKKLN